MSEEQSETSERPDEVELKPLKPLEPDLVSAMTRLMEGTPLDSVGPTLEAETTAVPYRRRMVPISNQVLSLIHI